MELLGKANPIFTEEVNWDRSLYFDDETFVVRP